MEEYPQLNILCLDNDVLARIFSFVKPPLERTSILSAVCRRFRDILFDEFLWQRRFENRFSPKMRASLQNRYAQKSASPLLRPQQGRKVTKRTKRDSVHSSASSVSDFVLKTSSDSPQRCPSAGGTDDSSPQPGSLTETPVGARTPSIWHLLEDQGDVPVQEDREVSPLLSPFSPFSPASGASSLPPLSPLTPLSPQLMADGGKSLQGQINEKFQWKGFELPPATTRRSTCDTNHQSGKRKSLNLESWRGKYATKHLLEKRFSNGVFASRLVVEGMRNGRGEHTRGEERRGEHGRGEQGSGAQGRGEQGRGEERREERRREEYQENDQDSILKLRFAASGHLLISASKAGSLRILCPYSGAVLQDRYPTTTQSPTSALPQATGICDFFPNFDQISDRRNFASFMQDIDGRKKDLPSSILQDSETLRRFLEEMDSIPAPLSKIGKAFFHPSLSSLVPSPNASSLLEEPSLFSPSLLFVSYSDGSIRCFNARTSTDAEVGIIRSHERGITDMTTPAVEESYHRSRTSHLMLTASLDQRVHLIDLDYLSMSSDRTTLPLQSFSGHKNTVNSVAWLRGSSNVFVTGSKDKIVRLYDIRTGKLPVAMTEPNKDWILCVHPGDTDNELLFSDKGIHRVDLRQMFRSASDYFMAAKIEVDKSHVVHEHKQLISSFRKDNFRIVSCSLDGSVAVSSCESNTKHSEQHLNNVEWHQMTSSQYSSSQGDTFNSSSLYSSTTSVQNASTPTTTTTTDPLGGMAIPVRIGEGRERSKTGSCGPKKLAANAGWILSVDVEETKLAIGKADGKIEIYNFL